MDLLKIYLYNNFIGTLTKDNLGGIIFQYDENAKYSLSLSLPIRERPYSNAECRGFFNGILPENENVRTIIGKRFGINPKNDFSILKSIGYDCAGAVSFLPEDALPNLQDFYKIGGTVLSDDELEKYIKELPLKPLALGAKDVRLSLAGAQDKTSVVKIGGNIALPDKDIPTTHILKPVIYGFKETIENEYICMQTAKKLGIDVPDNEICRANSTKYYLITRYDRKITCSDNAVFTVERIHQEDFCQAMNVASAYKYQSEGGVSFKQCFELLKKTTRPAVSIKKFINLMIFNYLIENNDAHGKNFSLLHHKNGDIEFAPAYDILCSGVYPELSDKMAMKIGNHYKHKEILPRHFEQLASVVDISYTQLKKIIKHQCDILPDIVKQVISTVDNTIGADILKIVEKNCKNML